MPGPGGRDFQQSYNCPVVVDSAHQVIVAARATNATSDKQQAVVMVEEAIGNVGTVPKELSADAGYYSAKAVEELYAMGVDPLIVPEKTRRGRVLEPAPRGRIPKGLSVRDRMRRKLRTKRGRERYARRIETVEPVFGQIKQGRGFRQFLLRGLAKDPPAIGGFPKAISGPGRDPTWVVGAIAGIIGGEKESRTVKYSEAEVLEDPGTGEPRNKEAGIKCQAQELLRV